MVPTTIYRAYLSQVDIPIEGISHPDVYADGRSKFRNGSAFKLAVYYLGIPAANHAPFPVTRMRSTGLAQVFGGAGESLSLMRKSPFTSS